MNITLVPSECNNPNTIFCPLTPEEFSKFKKEGLLHKNKRFYRLVLHHRDIQVECPVLMERNRPVGIIMPAFKLPYRPYPCYVYLYAAASHLAGISMRESAKKVQKKFGIPKFSHSTISRVFSKLLSIADLLLSIPRSNTSDAVPSYEFEGRPGWSCEKSKAAARLFKALKSILTNPESGTMLVYQFFMRYCRLLI